MADQSPRVYNGRYQLDRLIARGGMAEVFLARDALLDRPVALKVLFPEFATDRSFVERFRREARSAANLSHPNIVSVYDWGEEDGTYFIVMEHIEGRSLAQIIRDEGPLPPDRAADITADTAAALGFAHGNGVVHRDVKPGNILLGPTGVVKVADFGIARAVTTSENLTQTGTVMGTAAYFSPEQARGEPVDQRSDVYSLGVVLYEMLTGRPPFTGDNPVSVAYKHVQETPVMPRQVNPGIPGALEAVTLKAMAKDPTDRYATAEDLRSDLRRFRADQPVTAATVLAAPAPEATRAVYAGTAATTASPPVGGTRAMRQVEETYWDEEPPPERNRSTAFVIALVVLLALLAGLLYFFAQNLGLGDDDVTEVTAPDVVNRPVAEATQILTDARLEATITEEENQGVPAGTVFAQDPVAGAAVEEGSTVQLTVSAGAPPVTVPSVVGLNLDDATARLQALGLTADVRGVEDDDAPEGQVLDQDPDADDEVPAGTTVVLQVSSGPADVEVPDVIGQRAEDAGVALGRAGFEVAFEDEPSDDVEAGLVIRTEPGPGTPLAPGETVTAFTSSGPEARTVPDVVGETADDATAALQAAGFEVERSTRAVTDPAQDGVVVGQTPRASASAAPGSTVAIVIGQATATTTSTTTTTTTTTTAPPGQRGNQGGGGGGEDEG